MTDEAITLQTVLDHIQALRSDLGGRIDRLEEKMDKINVDLTAKIDTMGRRMDKLETNLTLQIDGLDKRLDTIEIAIVEQRHEHRIRKLEVHTGLVKAA